MISGCTALAARLTASICSSESAGRAVQRQADSVRARRSGGFRQHQIVQRVQRTVPRRGRAAGIHIPYALHTQERARLLRVVCTAQHGAAALELYGGGTIRHIKAHQRAAAAEYGQMHGQDIPEIGPAPHRGKKLRTIALIQFRDHSAFTSSL